MQEEAGSKRWALRVVRGGDGEGFTISGQSECGQPGDKEES